MTEHRPVLISVHQPKTGGVSLSEAIFAQYHDASSPARPADVDKMWQAGVYYFPGAGFFKPEDLSLPEGAEAALRQPDLRAVHGHCWYGVHRYLVKPYVYASMVRRPLQRLLSMFNLFPEWDSEERILRAFDEQEFRELDNDQTRRLSGREPQFGQCTDDMLEGAKHNIEGEFAVVGLTERFVESLAVMKHQLGWTGPVVRYHLAANWTGRTVDDLSDDLIDVIEQHNQLDAELWTWCSARFDEQIKQLGEERIADEVALINTDESV